MYVCQEIRMMDVLNSNGETFFLNLLKSNQILIVSTGFYLVLNQRVSSEIKI